MNIDITELHAKIYGAIPKLYSKKSIFPIEEVANTHYFQADGQFDIVKVHGKLFLRFFPHSSFIDYKDTTFVHDCKSCEYVMHLDKHEILLCEGHSHDDILKSYTSQELSTVVYDIYICFEDSGNTGDYNIILRYGDSPNQYFTKDCFPRNPTVLSLVKYRIKMILETLKDM